jgi:hypothetical protein
MPPNGRVRFDFVVVPAPSLKRLARAVKASDQKIDTRFIGPGSLWQNGHNESFNGVFRNGGLNQWSFSSVREVRLVVERIGI